MADGASCISHCDLDDWDHHQQCSCNPSAANCVEFGTMRLNILIAIHFWCLLLLMKVISQLIIKNHQHYYCLCDFKAINMDVNPLYLMLPVAMSSSFAFMLPVATPNNNIAFSYGRLTVMDMVLTSFTHMILIWLIIQPFSPQMKAGLVANLLCVLVLTCIMHTFGPAVFDFDTPWSNQTNIWNDIDV